MDIAQEGEHPEKGAEHILALCYPSNRFHMERMKCKESRDQCSPPKGAGCPLKDQKQQ